MTEHHEVVRRMVAEARRLDKASTHYGRWKT
jgi:hypothetical protein